MASKLEKVKKDLSEKELKAYEYFVASEEAEISPTTQAQLFELFLNGKSCQEIHKMNPGFQLGQIVSSRINGQWDELRKEYQDGLLKNVKDRAQQAQLETVVLLSDMLAAASKIHGKRLKKFIQTGDEKDLGGLRIESIRTLKDVLEMLLKATGQTETRKVQGLIEVEHHHTTGSPEEQADISLEASNAADVLRLLEDHKDGK